jgi:hypothetical protein
MRTSFSCASLFVFASLLSANVLGAVPADTLKADVRDALQDSYRVSKENRDVVVRRLVDLYGQLSTAEPVNDADRNRMQAQVRTRLTRLWAIIRRQMELEASGVKAVGQAVPDKQAVSHKQAVPDKAVPANARPRANEILAQQAVPPARPGPGAFRGGAIGPAGGVRAPVPPQPPDNGQALVDLIQRTIAPASWNVNGGPGAIVYFRPSRALVVRQRSEVHEQLQDVVRALRQ